MKKNKKTFIILALIIMSFTLLANNYLEKKSINKENLASVIIANRDIQINSIITKEDFVIVEKNKEEILPTAALTEEQLLGKRVIIPLYKGEQINLNRISKKDISVSPYFSLNLDNNDKALNLSPGTFIDIWKVPTAEGFKNNSKINSVKVFEKKCIAEIKNEGYVSINDFKNVKDETQDNVFVPQYIILNLSDEEVQELNSIDSNFAIRISLHSDKSYFENINNQNKKSENAVIKENTEEKGVTDENN